MSAATRDEVMRRLFSPLTTKVLVHDWNYGDYSTIGSGLLADSAVRTDPLFGGIAWHGYWGDPAVGSQVHGQYPAVPQFSTEHSGGTWIANQHNEDMADIVNYARNWSRSVVKWSLAVNQYMGPHNGGCGTCTGLITVQEGGARAGQVDYTIEYYTTGHLTKFRPARGAADRLHRQRHRAERRVPQPGRVQGAARAQRRQLRPVGEDGLGRAVLHLHPAGPHHRHVHLVRQPVRRGRHADRPITGIGGKCLDVTDNSSADGTPAQIWSCTGGANQQWTRAADGTLRSLGKCLDVAGGGTADGTRVQLWTCNGSAAQQWTWTAGRDLVNPQANKCLDVTGNTSADGTKTQIWSCTGGANQKWTLPS